MKCNHCGVEFHHHSQYNLGHKNHLNKTTYVVESCVCPSCKESNIFLIDGELKTKEVSHLPVKYVENVKWRRMIYPLTEQANPLPPEVPSEYRPLYNEAVDVLPISPRASAPLARTLLEMVLINQGAPKSRDLFAQIEWCLQQGVPSYIGETLDDVRRVGKFAAHFKQNAHNGEVLEVEPGEAEFVLANVVNLLDFYFVLPAKAKARSEAIKQKLDTSRQVEKGL